MLRARVVDRVHGDGIGVVVDRHVHRVAEGRFNSRTGTATAGEVVDDELFEAHAELGLHTVVIHYS